MAILPDVVNGSALVSGTTSDPAQPLTSWFAIQVSALPDLSRVQNEVSRLRDKGYDPYYRFEDTGSKGIYICNPGINGYFCVLL